jgi:predicted amidophosphoribosyltransferase
LKPGYNFSGLRVLLVDDILTTGATCSEAARTLREAGAAAVAAAVVARAQGAEAS